MTAQYEPHGNLGLWFDFAHHPELSRGIARGVMEGFIGANSNFDEDLKICMELLNTSKDTALRELSLLQEKGIIKRNGKGKNIYYKLA